MRGNKCRSSPDRVASITKKHIPERKNEIAPTDKSALLPQEKGTRRIEKEKENIFEDVGEGEEGKEVEEILLHLGRRKGNAVLLSRD